MNTRELSRLLMLLPACSVAVAAESPGGPEAFPLPRIAVIEKPLAAPPSMIVREAGMADFSAWNARTAADALRHTPGVNIQIGGTSGDATPWIRGFRDRDILILFDGIPIGNALEGSLDLAEVSLNTIETTRVMKSAPSVIYGANGLGGVIDLIPRAPDRYDTQSAALEISGNSGRALRGSFGSTAGDVDFFVTAGHEEAGNYELADDYAGDPNQPPGRRINSDFKRTTAALLVDVAGSPIGATSLFVNHSDVERGFTPRATGDDPDFERLTLSRRTTVGLSNRLPNLPVSVKLYYNRYDSDITVYTDSTYTTVDETDPGDDYSFGGIMYSQFDTIGTGRLVISGSLASDVFSAEGVFNDFDRAELNTLTLSAEHESIIGERLSLAIGAIYTDVEHPQVNGGLSVISPQVSMGYQANERLSLHASAAQRTRFPKLRELYRRRFGNPDLDEQQADNVELGARWAHGLRTATDVTVFHSTIDGLIDRPTRTSLYQNLAPVDVKGIELSTGGWVTDRMYARVSYAYVDIAESLAGGGERQLRSRPRNSAFVDLRARLAGDMLLSLNGLYVGGLFDLDDDDMHTRLPGFAVFDAKLSKSLTNGLTAYLAVSNLGDRNYHYRIGDPREGRTWRAGVTFER